MARRAGGQPGGRVRWAVVRRPPDCHPAGTSAPPGSTEGGGQRGLSAEPLLARRDRGPVPGNDQSGAPAERTAGGADLPRCGPTDRGFLIIAVWDSRESCDRFVQGTLMAKMPVEGGFEGRPEERAAEIVNLQTG